MLFQNLLFVGLILNFASAQVKLKLVHMFSPAQLNSPGPARRGVLVQDWGCGHQWLHTGHTVRALAPQWRHLGRVLRLVLPLLP